MKKLAFILLMVSYLPAFTLLQQNRIPVEPSETWLNRQHKPAELIEAIGMEEGMVIADIGAGRGRLSVWFADKVGETGKVYANDIDKGSLEYLDERCKRNNINNIITFPGKVDNPLLPPGEVDIAIIVSAYHHFDKPVEMLRNTVPCLKKEGILVVVERDPVKSGQTGRESTSPETLIRQAEEAGFIFIKVNTKLLERDNIYFFRCPVSQIAVPD